MRSATVLVLLCVAFAVTNASVVEALLKNLRLDSNVTYNTSKGLDLGYKAKIQFDPLNLNLLNFNAQFNAEKQDPQETDAPNSGAYKYNSNFSIEQSGRSANASTNGILGYHSQSNNSLDNGTYHITTSQGISNNNSWAVNGVGYAVQGDHQGLLESNVFINQTGNEVVYGQYLGGASKTQGKLGVNGTYNNLTDDRQYNLYLNEKVEVNSTDRTSPNATYTGFAFFNKGTNSTYNGNNFATQRQGTANYNGSAWVKTQNLDNQYFYGTISDTTGSYQSVGNSTYNGNVIENDTTTGVVESKKVVAVNVTRNGTAYRAASQGKLEQQTNALANGKTGDYNVTGNWSYLADAHIVPNQAQNSTGVFTNTTAKWGISSTNGTGPIWNFAGNKTISAQLNLDNTGSGVSGVSATATDDQQRLQELDDITGFLQDFTQENRP